MSKAETQSPAVRPLVPDGPGPWWRTGFQYPCEVFWAEVAGLPRAELQLTWLNRDGQGLRHPVEDDGRWRGPCLSLADVEAAQHEAALWKRQHDDLHREACRLTAALATERAAHEETRRRLSYAEGEHVRIGLRLEDTLKELEETRRERDEALERSRAAQGGWDNASCIIDDLRAALAEGEAERERLQKELAVASGSLRSAASTFMRFCAFPQDKADYAAMKARDAADRIDAALSTKTAAEGPKGDEPG